MVINMPRSIHELISDAEAEALADRFERYEPRPEDELDITIYLGLRDAAAKKLAVEREIYDLVLSAREGGFSWNLIGTLLGTSGEAARQRYGSSQIK